MARAGGSSGSATATRAIVVSAGTDRAAAMLHPEVASNLLGGHVEVVSVGVEETAGWAVIGPGLTDDQVILGRVWPSA